MAYAAAAPPPYPQAYPAQAYPPQEPPFIFGHAPQAGGYLPCFKHSDRLHSESIEGPATLREGQMLFSQDGMFYLTLRSTGDLAICLSSNHTQVWTNPKSWFTSKGDPPYYLVMQTDANLVLYNGEHHAIWSSKTAHTRRGQTSFVAVMQGDRNFIVYDMNNLVVWNAESNKNK